MQVDGETQNHSEKREEQKQPPTKGTLPKNGNGQNAVWGHMTIKSSAKPHDNIFAGHSWIEFKSSDGKVTKTFGLWDLPTAFQEDLELRTNYMAFASRTVLINNADIDLFNAFNKNSNNIEYSSWNTCAGYAANLWNSITGENLSGKELFGLITTPTFLTQSIIQANNASNQKK